jgi:ATP-dependent RNA helicase DDX55/SPB4
VIARFTADLPQFTHSLLIGGGNPAADVDRFISDGAHIIVATIGRLEDMFKRKTAGFDLAASSKALEVLILDEADRLLDMGFQANLNTIFSYLPKQRRTGLFSATQTREVEDLIRAGLRNPVRVSVKETTEQGEESLTSTPTQLKNYYMICESESKLSFLADFIRRHATDKLLVFFSNCASVDYFANIIQRILPKSNILSIHGKKDNRNKVFGKFRDLQSGVLMCTDVMGRGVDIPSLSWVIQYDPPSSASNFVHRCGRTARIGNTGNALVLLLPAEDAYVNFIALNQTVPLELLESSSEPIQNVLPLVKQLALTDRIIYEKGLKAFVSFVQSYAKHQCQLIFRFKDLNLGRLANGYGLLHLPRMPEMKGKVFPEFVKTEADYAKIPFKEKTREKQRQLKLQRQIEERATQVTQHKPKSVSWSRQKEQKEKKRKRKDIKSEKRKRQDDDDDDDDDDLEDIAKDLRLMKKLKTGKISKEDFNKEFGNE